MNTFLAVFAAVNVAAVFYLERKRLDYSWQVMKRFRPVMALECALLLAMTVILYRLIANAVPFLDYGWLNLFTEKGGNAGVSPVTDLSKSSSVLARLVPPLFLICILATVPFMARAEEEAFRQGVHDWRDVAWNSLKFGLVHCLVGVPVAGGLALVLPGFVWAHKYRSAFAKFENSPEFRSYEAIDREALEVSITYHALYNTIIFGFLLVLSILMAVPR